MTDVWMVYAGETKLHLPNYVLYQHNV
jgi:hypothetical protein